MKKLMRACLLMTVILILYPNASGRAQEASRLVFPEVFLPQSIQEKWFYYRTVQQQEKPEAAREALESLKKQAMDLGIENMDALSSILLQDAKDALNRGKMSLALDLSRDAQELSPNYPPAYFFRSRVLLRHRPSEILEVISEYLNGCLQAAQHVWLLLYAFGTGLFWIIVAGGAAMLTFILTVILRYTPRMSHLVYELCGKNLKPISIYFLLAVVLVGPLWLGVGVAWAMMWWLLLFWVFMTGRERGIALVFVVLTASAGLWLPLWVSVAKANGSEAFLIMARAVRGEAGIDPAGLAQISSMSDKNDGLFAMALGLQYKRSQQHDLTRQQFERAVQLMPEDERALINLGNVDFFESRLDEAIKRYQKALELNPNSVEAHYNLAQTYREKLMFDEGERYYLEAMRLDPEQTDQYARRTGLGDTYPVVDGSLGLSEVLRAVLVTRTDEIRKAADDLFALLWSVPLRSAPLIGLLFAAVLMLLSPRAYIKRLSFPCSLCGRSICQHCQRHIFHLRICQQCNEAGRHVKRLAELRQIQHRGNRHITLARFISVFFPGTGHLYLMYNIKGFLFIFLFFTLIFSVVWPELPFFVPYAWMVSEKGPGYATVITGMILIYLVVFWDLARIRDSISGIR